MIAIDSHIKPPKTGIGKRKVAAQVRAAYEAYAEAYVKSYGMRPELKRYDETTKLVYVGSSAGVTVKRLKEMTRQLEFRRS